MTSPGKETFAQRLWREAEAKQSWVCLGLDIDLERLPESLPRSLEGAEIFLRTIIEACSDLVVAFKPNLAFYTALGADGLHLLTHVRDAVGEDAIVILDGKVGDVGDTSEKYAKTMFDVFEADAITFNAWGGRDAIQPLIRRADRGAFAWVRSSNPGADEIQGISDGDGRSVFMDLARSVAAWNVSGNLGTVVGATRPRDLELVRALTPGMPILAPGVGVQGGDLVSTVQRGFGEAPGGVLVNAGRSVLWAGQDTRYADVVRQAVEDLRSNIEDAKLTKRNMT
jgi:orotidine-5'-phosphate decarboxylase